MSTGTAALVIIFVVALLVGGILTLRSSSRTGMPSQDVLDRAKERAREIEEQERAEQGDRKD